MEEKIYDPESYWSEVAGQIEYREDGVLLAGDNEPYYAYKRKKFLQLIRQMCSFQGKTVLEIGSGPGGNITEVLNDGANKAVGVDISNEMIALARNNVKNKNAEFVKIDGKSLPFPDQSFDLVFTATVLQHNTNDSMMREILAEACRVAKSELVLVEKIDKKITGTDLCLARPIEYYAAICEKSGFKLVGSKHINIRISYFISGAIRKLFNPKSRKEGEPISKISRSLQNLSLPLTKPLDNIFHSSKDLGCLLFKRI